MFWSAINSILNVFGTLISFIFAIQLAPNFTLGGLFISLFVLTIFIRLTLSYLELGGIFLNQEWDSENMAQRYINARDRSLEKRQLARNPKGAKHRDYHNIKDSINKARSKE